MGNGKIADSVQRIACRNKELEIGECGLANNLRGKTGGKISLIAILVLIGFPCLRTAAGFSAVHEVPARYPTIQAAIDAAADGDIVVVADGTYTGLGNRDIDFKGKAITVTSEHGPLNCIIDCQGSFYDRHRGFNFHLGESINSILWGFTIVNGYSPMDYIDLALHPAGGAIYCSRSSPVISNCILKNNRSDHWGGAVLCRYYSNPLLINLVIKNNLCDWNGGGVYCFDNSGPIIRNCTIANNSAPNGGGLCTEWRSVPVVFNSIIWDNSILYDIYDTTPPIITFSDIQGGWNGEGNINIDPRFVDPNGDDVYLLSDSPCIDTCTFISPGDIGMTDVDGNPRILDGNGDGNSMADMGAYEFNPGKPLIAISCPNFNFYYNPKFNLKRNA